MSGARALIAALLLVAAASSARAQAASPADALHDRTGPAGAPQSLPALTPPAVLPPLAREPQTPAHSTTSAGLVTLADVKVTASAPGANARPRRGWRPIDDPATGLKLSLQPTDRLDPAWVRRQFVENQLVGRPVPLDRLVALAQLINLAFARNGYINSGLLLGGQIPQDGGVLDVRLVYGRTLARDAKGAPVAVGFGPRGRKGLTAGYLRDRLGAAVAVPFNALAVEQQFRLLAQDPAIRTINADLRPGDAAGEAALAVTVDPQPRFDAYVSAANSRSPSIGGQRVAAGGSVRNLAFAGDLATGEYGLTHGHGDFALGYETPFVDPATTMSLHGGRNDAAVVDPQLRPLGITSKDWSVEGGLARRLIDTPLTPDANGGIDPAQTLTLGLRVIHREQRTTLLGAPFSFSPGSVDGRSRYTAARLTGDFIDRGVSQVLALSLTGTLGLDGTKSTLGGSLDPSPHFAAVLAQVSYARRLDSRGLELRARMAGQLANGPLYTGERFSAGGADSVRGYRENLLLADDGVFGSLELAQPFSLTGGRTDATHADWGAFTASGFLDAASVGDRGGPDPSPNGIASLGASLAWTPSEAVSARVTYAAALKKAPVVGKRDIQDRGFEFSVIVHPLTLLAQR